MRRTAFLSFLLCTAMAEAQERPRVVLAVFAHPDDETFVGPMLARYAREGVKVYLGIATKGEKGITEHAGIPAGDQLTAVRRAEATCACQQLGIEPPIFFEFKRRRAGRGDQPAKNGVFFLGVPVDGFPSQVLGSQPALRSWAERAGSGGQYREVNCEVASPSNRDLGPGRRVRPSRSQARFKRCHASDSVGEFGYKTILCGVDTGTGQASGRRLALQDSMAHNQPSLPYRECSLHQ